MGIDVAPAVIDWLRENYGSKLPNFDFVLLDARGTKYNRKGSVDPANVQLPFADASFDVACAFAVFMHMSLDGIRNYLAELSRVLHPGGSLLVTFNAIWEDEDEPEHRGRRYESLGGGLYTRQPDKQNASMGHHVTLIRELLADAGLELLEEVRGQWHATGVSAHAHGSDLFALRRP